MANLAALRAAVFFAICEKPQGGGVEINPPPPVRGLILCSFAFCTVLTDHAMKATVHLHNIYIHM